MTPREALNTSACMMLAMAVMGPWGVVFGYGVGEVVNRALRGHGQPPSGGGARLRTVGPRPGASPDLPLAAGDSR